MLAETRWSLQNCLRKQYYLNNSYLLFLLCSVALSRNLRGCQTLYQSAVDLGVSQNQIALLSLFMEMIKSGRSDICLALFG